MTVNELVHLGIRRWYIFAFGLICALAGSFALKAEPWTFVAQTEFIMAAPGQSVGSPPRYETQESLIAFADIVGRLVNNEEFTYPLSSPTATLFGNGLREGSAVRLLNRGTQWQSAFTGPIISVQVIGTTEADVQSELERVTLQIQRLTKTVQEESRVSADSYITVEADPDSLVINAFGPTKTSKFKGTLLLVFFALCISMLIARGTEQVIARNLNHQLNTSVGPPKVPVGAHSPRNGSI